FLTIIIVIIIAVIKTLLSDNIDSLPGIFRLFLSRDNEMTSAIREATQNHPVRSKRSSLAPLKTKDPDFDEAFFIERAKKSFEIIQKSWSDRNLEKAESFLSDGIYEQFSIQLSEMKEKGIVDFMSNLRFSSVYPVGLQSDKIFDVIHLRFDVSAVNFRKDEKTGKVIDGSNSPEPFSEVWSFIRKPGAKTTKKPGLIEGQCPNCGNPIKIGRMSKCDVCNALLRSGEHDWVLVSITQACEWAIRQPAFIPGLDILAKQDPGFNRQHLIERTSVIFWRKIETDRTGKIEFLRKMARNEFCDNLSTQLKPDQSGQRQIFTQCAVGAINLLGFNLKEPEDEAAVEVVWSGWQTTIGRDRSFKMASNPVNHKSVFILSRKHGAQTKLESSLASAHCPSCGAPEQTGAANECQYCGAVMNDGQKEWVLETITNRYDQRVTAITSQKQQAAETLAGQPGEASEVSSVEILRYTVAMMLADGNIAPQEMEMISNLAQRMTISPKKLENLINEVKSFPNPVDHVIETSVTEPSRALMQQLARVALADGQVTEDELQMLKKLGRKLEMTAFDVGVLIKNERNQLYQEAKDLLKNKPNS
ncbi:MAG: TIM44-like domain-containing protein, partial [Candidatus Rifleibacteriota bacterium]